jgi:hypothetical protein
LENNKFILHFKSELLKIEDESFTINNEIRQIDNISSIPSSVFSFDMYNTPYINNLKLKFETNSKFKIESLASYLFISVFNEYLMNGNFSMNSLPENRFKERDIKVAKEAIDFAEYYKWLKDLNPQTSQKDNNNKKLDNVNQKILALHYLGLKMNAYETLHFSKVLAGILDVNFENIRKNIPHIHGKNGIKTKKNLKKLQELFENQNFKLISKKIEEDLNDIE